MGKWRLCVLSTVILLGFIISPCPLLAQTRLYLKNGSFEMVKTYEIQGDRVRYYSLERSEWEEIPKSQVDFEATERAQAEEKARQQKQVRNAVKLEHERFDVLANSGYEIRPGIRLPADSGVYAFDGTRIIRLIQSPAEVVSDKKRAALIMVMPGPLLKKRALVVLSGNKAAVRISNPQPAFFIQDSDNWGSKAELFPLVQKKDARIVEKINSGLGVGKSGETREPLPLMRKQIAAGLYELKPAQPLASGEYALGELLEQKLNIDVWDFGIDPGSGK
jgi:hypothetical protein